MGLSEVTVQEWMDFLRDGHIVLNDGKVKGFVLRMEGGGKQWLRATSVAAIMTTAN